MAACSSVEYRSLDPKTELYLEGETLFFIGEITLESEPKFFDLVTNNKITKLAMSSGGGNIHAGMRIATWVYDSGVDIEIIGFCGSSCANYIFLAAKNKYIVGDSIVAWHGNFHDLLWRYQNSLPQEPERLDSILHGVRSEVEFFEHVGIDEIICRIGKMAPRISQNFYTLDDASLEYFSVNNVYRADVGQHSSLYNELIGIVDDKPFSIVHIGISKTDIEVAKNRYPIDKRVLRISEAK